MEQYKFKKGKIFSKNIHQKNNTFYQNKNLPIL